LTKLFKFLSFLLLSFTLGYSQGWWRSYESTSAPKPLIILTLEEYKNHPFLQTILWEKLEKVIPYKVVIEKLPNLDGLRTKLSTSPIKAHLVFLERKELLQIQPYFASLKDFSANLIDNLKGDFTLEPKGKYFPILWRNKNCKNEIFAHELKIWGFILPRISRRASKKSLLFLSDLIHNPIANQILRAMPYHLTLKNTELNNPSITDTLRNSLFID
jgi:hypothetical protein